MECDSDALRNGAGSSASSIYFCDDESTENLFRNFPTYILLLHTRKEFRGQSPLKSGEMKSINQSQ